MKKIISILTIFSILTLIITGNTYAATLDTLDVSLSSETVRPGEEVNVIIEFGRELGAYTFQVLYDNNIFDYVKVSGAEANDNGDKVIATYFDTRAPRTGMTMTFKAKEGITTSNPTEFKITAQGLATADNSIRFEDITTALERDVTVEPEYVPYTLSLSPTGEILKEDTDVTIKYSSPMGRYYDKARLVASAVTPEGASVRLLAVDQARVEYDIIDSGWGDSQGFAIGGKDVLQTLQAKAIFSDYGDYSITLKLIDREKGDATIAEKTFTYSVVETLTQPEEPQEEPKEEPAKEQPKTPQKLPKTGSNIYAPAVVVLMSLIGAYVYNNKKK